MKNKAKLDQLTSLRFFAALMIVFHHSEGLFGLGPAPVNLGQGVSFFFILSGFILAYVYPRLDGVAEVRKFWLARFARIWPAYVVTFVFAYALLPFQWNSLTGTAHLAMVQSWLPLSVFYFSYNAVAWSISTEVFFYLAFPFLIRNWHSTWKIKLVGTAALLIGLLALVSWLHLPDYGNPYNGRDGWKATVHGFIYVNPIARLLEFVTGMALANLLRARTDRGIVQKGGETFWTVAEVSVLVLCAGVMYWSTRFAETARTHFGDPTAMWLIHSGAFLGFAAVVFVMACGGGAVSRALQWRPLVVLGEISFSMYLLHQTLMSVWRGKAALLPSMPAWAVTTVFFAVLLTLSYLMWTLVEQPARRALLSPRAGRATLPVAR